MITVHGKPAAELCPVEAADTDLENRLARLAERGIVVRRTAGARLEPVVRKSGALARFLAERE